MSFQLPIIEANEAVDDRGVLLARLVYLVVIHGCALLRRDPASIQIVDHLTFLAAPFGNPVYHNLSDPFGIHPIKYIPGFPEYANANVEELGLHTDGSFETDPPVFMMIHCECASGSGGESVLASGDQLYKHLKEARPDYLEEVMRPDAFTIWRDDRKAARSIFSPMGDRLRLAYRSGKDVRIKIHPAAKEAFEYIRSWLLAPQNSLEFRLEPGETLIFDNTRMLHGRKAFRRDSNRSLHGLWLDGKPTNAGRLRFGIDPLV